MISRVAESCFWLNRYMERVETLARILDVNLAFVLDVSLPLADRWRPLLIVSGEEPRFAELFGAEAANDAEAVQRYLTWNEESACSIYSSLRYARENARTIRETISLEMWETINHLWLWLSGRLGGKLYDKDRHEFYLRLRDQSLLFHGICHNTVLHEEPFDFMRLGTALERAGQTARILDVKYHAFGPTGRGPETSAETAQWLAILRSCSAIEPFFKRTGNVLSGSAIAAFLMLDERFPRSVLHNLARAENFLRRIRPLDRPQVGARSAALLEALLMNVQSLTVDKLVGTTGGIHTALTEIIGRTAGVCDLIHEELFDPPLPAKTVTSSARRAQVQRQG